MSFRSTLLAAVAVIGASTSAFAAPVDWASPSGSQPTFDYQQGQSQTGKFSDGIGLPNGFALFPSNFSAVAPQGQTLSQQVGDTLSVILNAKPNHVIKSITSSLLGDYSILGRGEVDSSGQLRVTNLDTMQVLSSNFTYNGLPAATHSSLEGKWDGGTAINLPAGWKNVKVEVDGLVSAYTDSTESTALIDAKVANVGVETAVVPLPAAVFAAPAALVVAYRARRKMARK
ncbi:MAG: hypothetical protein QM770_23835 [Tepidisphaeraceae bacterium]